MAVINKLAIGANDVSESSQQVLIVEAPAGAARNRWIDECLEGYALKGARVFHLPCDFERGGPWAGVTELFSELFSEIQYYRPDLIEPHGFELGYILPSLRRSLKVRNPNLTDLAPSSEKTRNYPADRAVRNIHGLIDLIDEWKTAVCPAAPWLIFCDALDKGGVMGSLFLRELIRRRGKSLNIRLLGSASPGNGQSLCTTFDAGLETGLVAPGVAPQPPTRVDSLQAAEAAAELEERIADDELERQANLPRLVYLWKAAHRAEKVLRYQFQALETYNTQGLYADAIRYGDGLLDLALQQAPDDDELRWLIFQKLLMSHIGLDDIDTSLKLAEEVGLPLAEKSASRRNHLFYLMAIFYARFKKPRDFPKGEEYLELSLAAIAESDLPEGERHFRYVFNRNGLAMIRNFQRRPLEAIELCRSGFAY
jgi:hypothetical protein